MLLVAMVNTATMLLAVLVKVKDLVGFMVNSIVNAAISENEKLVLLWSFHDNKDFDAGAKTYQQCTESTAQQLHHLKMIRLLVLCLLLHAATASSEVTEGSGGEGIDDEDLYNEKLSPGQTSNLGKSAPGSTVDRSTGETSDQFSLIVIAIAVTLLALSVAVVIAVMLARRHMHNRQQGIYSVPTEQDQKAPV
ncbi:hypothetical protein LDENG_00132500 [Lucifuga dentata]|nr:hypothetical protein LDENG_00132500 [Lucifuga dentata]